MKRPSFTEGVLLALLVSISASFLYAIFIWVLSLTGVLQLLITVISISYVLYILVRSGEKTGRVVVLGLLFSISAVMWLIDVPLVLFSLVHLMMLWIVRSLYYYSSITSSLIDFSLIGLGLVFSTWSFYQTGIVFMSIWSFFLTQSLFVFIPEKITVLKKKQINENNSAEFDQAFKNANNAIHKLTVNN